MEQESYVLSLIYEQITELPFYITGAAINFVENGTVRQNGAQEYQIMQVVKGTGRFICGGVTYTLNKADIVVFLPDIPHEYGNIPDAKELFAADWAVFMVNSSDTLMRKLAPQGFCILKQVENPKFAPDFRSMTALLKQNSIYSQMQASVLLYGMITDLLAIKYGLSDQTKGKKVFKPIISYMEENLERDISVEELSELMGMSVSYLTRKFKAVFMESPIAYLIKLRMLKAQELLSAERHIPIKNIASKCGYKDVSYFCSVFKKHFRLTPVEYREALLHDNRKNF